MGNQKVRLEVFVKTTKILVPMILVKTNITTNNVIKKRNLCTIIIHFII